MTRHRLLWGALGWVAVVVAVSAMTWTVINAAGRDVLETDQTAAVGASTAGSASPRVSGTPGAKPTHRPKHPKGTPTGRPSARPSQSSPPTGSASPTPPPSSAPPTSAAPQPTQKPAQPQAVVRTWQGAAGSVTARCEGRTISLQSATPADGWRIEVGSRGPEHVEVEFKGGGGREVKVEARCVGGVPRFRVESSGGGSESESKTDPEREPAERQAA